jgi:hypothetical protein
VTRYTFGAPRAWSSRTLASSPRWVRRSRRDADSSPR